MHAEDAVGAGADVHRDEDLGWTMQVPRGWKRIPLPSEERWVVAKYLCDRKYPTKDGWDHVPELKVIFSAPERYLGKLRRGSMVTVSTTAFMHPL